MLVGVRVGVKVTVEIIGRVIVEVSGSINDGVNVTVGVLDARLLVGTYRVAVLVGRGGGRWVLVGGRVVFVAIGGSGAVGIAPAPW